MARPRSSADVEDCSLPDGRETKPCADLLLPTGRYGDEVRSHRIGRSPEQSSLAF